MQKIKFCYRIITVEDDGYVYSDCVLLGKIEKCHTSNVTYRIIGVDDLDFPFLSIKSAAIALFMYRIYKMCENY